MRRVNNNSSNGYSLGKYWPAIAGALTQAGIQTGYNYIGNVIMHHMNRIRGRPPPYGINYYRPGATDVQNIPNVAAPPYFLRRRADPNLIRPWNPLVEHVELRRRKRLAFSNVKAGQMRQIIKTRRKLPPYYRLRDIHGHMRVVNTKTGIIVPEA